ncbi:MBL fold metallo-hydrolase [Desulfosporosinus sp. BICA1-9]|uniref:MBL fold metallo-hydrolase n=1 Tax=Desulfosporosinus sp. BICA1-9 TaxID=1531958 RepID=UPI00054B73EC|nr:MBL fold metallo-hydrolase [Desulfosporosinus sp. BICA1-9]KJS48526.1 MAG: beta-lactamase [Peptococcaceae bacterium BRH_c23]KJS77943.1 MAG: beta-lactamase [Desulfosporosinus sp. BICA1-9]HBW33911.1 MBL fold metallo-hydrolase [Desulfosporosinus sp.]
MIEGRAVGPISANCYLYACMETKKAVIIDPGAEAKKIQRWILEKGVKVDYILLTHGHIDHIGAVDELRDLLGGNVQVGIHEGDAGMLTDGRKNLSGYMGQNLVQKKADILLEDGQELVIGNERLKVISTPGHSPGGACFLCSEGLFSGDTLFAGSIGRTDFPGGSLDQLLAGVKKKLLILPEETLVFPGHGEATTIGEEKRDNPFLG